MTNRMGLPEAGQQENLSKSHILSLIEFEVPWYIGVVLVAGGGAATVMYVLDKAAEWGVL